jgi:hypothetical protein
MEIRSGVVLGAQRDCGAVDFIAASPRRWPIGLRGTRKFVLQRFPFAIIYRERETDVQVLAIARGHRRPSYWKNDYSVSSLQTDS